MSAGTDPAGDAAEPRVLLVEDDRGLRESLATVLEFQGLQVHQAESVEDARTVLPEQDPHLVILDVNLPGESGLEFLVDLRSRGDDRQVLLLTARHEVADRVAGLDAGADDYLPKPFALDELLARVRLLLRRSASGAGSGSSARSDHGGVPQATAVHTLGPITMDGAARRVTRAGFEVELTKMEFDLLELLLVNQDTVLTRAVLHERLWGYDGEYGSNTLEVLVSGLRRKLEDDGSERIVHTVRGVGYVARPRRQS